MLVELLPDFVIHCLTSVVPSTRFAIFSLVFASTLFAEGSAELRYLGACFVYIVIFLSGRLRLSVAPGAVCAR